MPALTAVVESDIQAQPDAAPESNAPFLLRAVRDLKVPERIRLCGLLSVAAGVLPTLVLLLRLHPADPTSIEKGTITSLLCWTVLVQFLGLLVAALIGRQILIDIGLSLRRLGELVQAISLGKNSTAVPAQRRSDEIGALAEALQQMIQASDDDRHKLIQGNVALVLSNERLAQTNMELEMAGAKVRQLAEQAETANVAKRNFLAVMSHEIRTPVNGIIGMTELALKTPLNALQCEYLESVNSSAQSLLELLNDVLDFSKIEAGKLELEVVDFSLRDTLDEAVAAYAARYHAKGIELILDIRPEVPDALVGDPYRLRQVVLNLVGNALRFTSEGEVVVRAELAELGPVETMLRFTVTDTGCGIPSGKRDAIFESFTQADSSTTRRFGGTGLGLTICKQLTQLMGGWISAQSEAGGGSEFQFRARFGVGATLTPPRNETLRGKRILIAESHPTNAKLLAEALGAWGLEVETADNATTALLHVAAAQRGSKPFDFVLVDTVRPATGGLDLAKSVSDCAPRAPRLVLLVCALKRDDLPALPPETMLVTKPVRLRKLHAALEATFLPTPAPEPATISTVVVSQFPHGRQLRVLVAEDHAANQRIVRTHLENWGHVVVTADNGKEAVAQFAQGGFDFIFMDLQMPQMDGLTATGNIRQMEEPSTHVPIVALTANVLKGVREECLAAGMDGYLGKPVREHELLSALEMFIPGLQPIAAGKTRPAKPAPHAVVAPSLPFDVPELLASVNGSRELLASLLRDSRDYDIPELVTELSKALAGNDAEGVRRAAHAIKGVVSIFHAPAAYDAARHLEDIARSGKRKKFAQGAAELLRTVFDLLTALERFLAGPAVEAA